MRPNRNESGRLLQPFCCGSRVTFTPPPTPTPPPALLPSDGQADAAEAQCLIGKGLMNGRHRQERSCMLLGGTEAESVGTESGYKRRLLGQ